MKSGKLVDKLGHVTICQVTPEDVKEFAKNEIDNNHLNFYSCEGKVDKSSREVVIKLKY